MAGGQRAITITREERCRRCDGVGALRSSEVRCAACHGAGVVKSTRGHMVFSKPCADCLGTGRRADVRCPACAGRQIEIRAEIVAVNLPPGLADGARVRLRGKGHAGRNHGEYGDLIRRRDGRCRPGVQARGQRHPRRLADRDRRSRARREARGSGVSMRPRTGRRVCASRPGRNQVSVFASADAVRRRATGVRGDLVVEVRVALPRVLDERSKELLREFGRLNAASEVRQPEAGDQ
jgi:molecular chaperone DnaJ